jgi:hypothetical protein
MRLFLMGIMATTDQEAVRIILHGVHHRRQPGRRANVKMPSQERQAAGGRAPDACCPASDQKHEFSHITCTLFLLILQSSHVRKGVYTTQHFSQAFGSHKTKSENQFNHVQGPS